MPTSPANPLKVFLSYSHDSPEHGERVLGLADRLRSDGIDAHLDQYEVSPSEGWPRWMRHQIDAAGFVLVVCTETYDRRYRGQEHPGHGLGATWEGAILTQELYEAVTRNTKIVPVVFSDDDAAHVPTELRGFTRYGVHTEEGYEALYRHLTDQPKVRKPELGKRRALPVRDRRQPSYASDEVRGGSIVLEAANRTKEELKSSGRDTTAVDAEILELRPRLREGGAGSPAPGQERIHEQDGSVLVYVPAGKYTLGAKDISKREKPVHQVNLRAFWISKYPVTNEQYELFLRTNPDQEKLRFWQGYRFNQPRQPVVGVSWNEAAAYCRWAGLNLPSEAQWEAAARGTDQRRYPWGNEKPSKNLASFGNWFGGPAPVDRYPDGAGPFGTLDQAGNVWEWCLDVWDPQAYKGRDGEQDPVATSGESGVRVLRGGTWVSPLSVLVSAFRFWGRASFLASALRLWGRASFLVSAFRFWGRTLHQDRNVGFRCVFSVPAEP